MNQERLESEKETVPRLFQFYDEVISLSPLQKILTPLFPMHPFSAP